MPAFDLARCVMHVSSYSVLHQHQSADWMLPTDCTIFGGHAMWWDGEHRTLRPHMIAHGKDCTTALVPPKLQFL